MQDIDSILQKLEEKRDVKDIRDAIADFFIDRLRSVKDSLGYWEKACFYHAIVTFRDNINLSHQPRTLWLRACIVNIEEALVPVTERDEKYTRRDEQIDSLTYEQLMDEIESLRKCT